MPGSNIVAAFNFNNVIVSLGPVRLGNFGEDGGVTFEYPSEAVNHKVSADGRVTVSKMNDDRMIATVTLMQTSPSNAAMWGSWRAQEAAFAQGLPIPGLPFNVANIRTGDTVNAGQAIILQPPAPDQGQEAGEYEWQILLPYAKRSLVLGILNGIPGPSSVQGVTSLP